MRKILAFLHLAAAPLALLLALWGQLAAAAPIANPNASPEARRVLAYLTGLSNAKRAFVAGQMLGTADGYGLDETDSVSWGYSHYVEPLKAETGKLVGLVGANYARLPACKVPNPLIPKSRSPYTNCDGSAPDYSAANAVLAKHWRAGGLVTIYWHAPNPWTGGNAHDMTINGAFSDLYAPGNPAYATFHKMLDDLALGLDDLQKKGVVVLLRLFPEQNGFWFWWGHHKDGDEPAPEQYRALWRETFTYLTKAKKLNNLIWVFCAGRESAPGGMLKYMPDGSLFDIFAVDYYTETLDKTVAFSDLDRVEKPIAVAEYGPSDFYARDPATAHKFDFLRIFDLKARVPRMAYFMAWPGSHLPQALTDNKNADKLLESKNVLSVGDIDWRAGR